MLKLLTCTTAVLLLAGACATATASVETGMTISFGSAQLVTKQEADVGVTVWCEQIDHQESGSVTVTLVQGSGSKTTTGSGSVPIVCDGTAHTYVVPVVTADRWRKGDASATATGAANGLHDGTVCIEDQFGHVECQSFQLQQFDTGSAGPEPIILSTG